jgi:hypothetical protein
MLLLPREMVWLCLERRKRLGMGLMVWRLRLVYWGKGSFMKPGVDVSYYLPLLLSFSLSLSLSLFTVSTSDALVFNLDLLMVIFPSLAIVTFEESYDIDWIGSYGYDVWYAQINGE